MKPGRFVSYWFLYLRALMLAGFLSEVVTGQYQFQSIIYMLSIAVPAVVALFFGVTRIRNSEQEEWPAEYGLWRDTSRGRGQSERLVSPLTADQRRLYNVPKPNTPVRELGILTRLLEDPKRAGLRIGIDPADS